LNLVQVLEGANVALGVLQARLVLVITLVFTFALFCWAMWLQTALGAIISALWGLTIFLPVLFAGRGVAPDAEAVQHDTPPA
jgi:hypothetical protein